QRSESACTRSVVAVRFFRGYVNLRDLHSFPTRRSSDLGTKSQVSINAWTAGGNNMSPAPRRFTIMVDEPSELGGVDGAPNPVEVLLSALAGCVTAGIATNAQMFGVPIDAIDIDLEADVDARGFLGHDQSVRN